MALAVSPTPARAGVTASNATSALARGCGVAGVTILRPRSAAIVVGPTAGGSASVAGVGRLAYPDDGSIVTATGLALARDGCTVRRARGGAYLQGVSLFRGAVTASVVAIRERRSAIVATVEHLRTGGSGTDTASSRVPLGSWGYVVVRPPGAIRIASGAFATGALAVHLTRAHAGLPAGSVVLVGATTVPASVVTRARQKAKQSHAPLTVMPPLAPGPYVFPVAGPSDYVDTYGGFRGDVPGNWHHGDDIFAPLGTPVVAVASGTINRVGWNRLGGWRVWVRDAKGDEFYYAHLSGYAPRDLYSTRVNAGQVIGFIGNTGDAFATSPHVHFEVHPRQLLRLGYDGAVDPTRYLDRWRHLAHVRAPVPVHPPLPRQPEVRKQAVYVFRELLAARHIVRYRPPALARPRAVVKHSAGAALVAAPPLARLTTMPPGLRISRSRVAIFSAVGGLALFGATLALTRLSGSRRRDP